MREGWVGWKGTVQDGAGIDVEGKMQRTDRSLVTTVRVHSGARTPIQGCAVCSVQCEQRLEKCADMRVRIIGAGALPVASEIRRRESKTDNHNPFSFLLFRPGVLGIYASTTACNWPKDDEMEAD